MNELRQRKLPSWGRKDQVASREWVQRVGAGAVFCTPRGAGCRAPRRACAAGRPLQAAHTIPPPCAAAAGVYSALMAEGRALSSEESAAIDAELGLDVSGPAPAGSGAASDSDDGVGPEEEDEALASRELERNPLLALQASPSGRFLSEANYERLLSNAASLQVRGWMRGRGGMWEDVMAGLQRQRGSARLSL